MAVCSIWRDCLNCVGAMFGLAPYRYAPLRSLTMSLSTLVTKPISLNRSFIANSIFCARINLYTQQQGGASNRQSSARCLPRLLFLTRGCHFAVAYFTTCRNVLLTSAAKMLKA